MNVADIQKHFRSLAEFAERAGASGKVLMELGSAAEALEPFESLTVAQFGVFLRAADEYARNGIVPTGPKPKVTRAPKAPATPRAPKATVVSPDQAIERIYALYETMVHGNHTEEAIAKELNLVGSLTKPSLQKLAEKMNIWQAVKKLGVPAIKAKIQDEVRERKNRFERSDY